jgi:hypothetical protein
MSDFLPLDGVALPQLRTTSEGDRVEMPNVSPGHTDGSPNWLETCTGADAKVDREALRQIARPWPGSDPMSSLRESLAEYLAVRRALGYRLDGRGCRTSA